MLRGGTPYFNALLKLINAAKFSIHLQVYIFTEDDTGKEVAAALMAAAKRGVAVYLLLDGYASQDLSGKFIKEICDAGVNFRFFEPLLKSEHYYFGRRLHHKITVVDGFYSLVTGVNINNRYNDLKSQPAWLDWAVCCEGEVSHDLYKICIQLWSKSGKLFKRPIHQTIQHNIQEHCSIRVRRNDWVKRHNQISKSYIDMLRSAKSHVTIMSSYFIPGWVIRKRLSKAAQKGIKITLILTGISDVKIAKSAECYMYRWCFKKGIEIYEYDDNVLHGKLATQDGKFTTIGSYNINNISAYASVELNLDVADEGFTQKTDKLLAEIIKKNCTHITPSIYEQRYGYIKKSLQFLSYILIRFMVNISTFYFKQGN